MSKNTIFCLIFMLIGACTFNDPARDNPLDPKWASYKPSFEVVSINPENGSTITTGTTIENTFSKPINTTTVTWNATLGACTGSVHVSNTNFTDCIGASILFSPDASKIRIDTTGWTQGATYYIKLTTDILATEGAIPLKQEYTFSVNTSTGA
ncbi:MAG: hypothetical protein D6767_05520 [Candidatus Hydrogenedentota bacterium]|nr:MAG: hypothetical protein D6767_05520 [Candidatus Hydrogenedentota bacterium]